MAAGRRACVKLRSEMVLLFPVILVAAGFVIWRARRAGGAAPASDGRGWHWFAAWSLAAALTTFSFLTGFTVGLFVLPLAAAAVLWVAGRSPHLREGIGAVAGVGAVLLLAALLNRDYEPCPKELSLPAGAPPGASVSCGGYDPAPWFVAGLALSGCALLAYGVALWRGSRTA